MERECQKCGNKWEPRVRYPKVCSACKSKDWQSKEDTERKPPHPEHVTCRQCGYIWPKRTAKPKRCPYCQSMHWNMDWQYGWAYFQEPNENPRQKKCNHCGHSWLSRTDDPKTCPGCKSIHWKYIRQKTWIPPQPKPEGHDFDTK